mmetsp:Transcript_8340/g.18217  ORF Transcript_8340/g.18217 Transcript_8340/m.18217 type:complete len:253 (+) Transcript_8340:1239-1997(+)
MPWGTVWASARQAAACSRAPAARRRSRPQQRSSSRSAPAARPPRRRAPSRGARPSGTAPPPRPRPPPARKAAAPLSHRAQCSQSAGAAARLQVPHLSTQFAALALCSHVPLRCFAGGPERALAFFDHSRHPGGNELVAVAAQASEGDCLEFDCEVLPAQPLDCLFVALGSHRPFCPGSLQIRGTHYCSTILRSSQYQIRLRWTKCQPNAHPDHRCDLVAWSVASLPDHLQPQPVMLLHPSSRLQLAAQVVKF